MHDALYLRILKGMVQILKGAVCSIFIFFAGLAVWAASSDLFWYFAKTEYMAQTPIIERIVYDIWPSGVMTLWGCLVILGLLLKWKMTRWLILIGWAGICIYYYYEIVIIPQLIHTPNFYIHVQTPIFYIMFTLLFIILLYWPHFGKK